MANTKKSFELISAALIGSAVGAAAVALSKDSTKEKIGEGFENLKEMVQNKIDEIKSQTKEAKGDTKKLLKQEIEKAEVELKKAKDMLS